MDICRIRAVLFSAIKYSRVSILMKKSGFLTTTGAACRCVRRFAPRSHRARSRPWKQQAMWRDRHRVDPSASPSAPVGGQRRRRGRGGRFRYRPESHGGGWESWSNLYPSMGCSLLLSSIEIACDRQGDLRTASLRDGSRSPGCAKNRWGAVHLPWWN